MAQPERYAIFSGDNVWTVLGFRNDEYSLYQTTAIVPLVIADDQPRSTLWADQFDALAACDGLKITWATEVATYQAAGRAKAHAAGLVGT